MSALLQVRDLRVRLNSGPATWLLRDANLGVESGRTVGLVGESGAGKTMMSRAVLGFLPANSTIVSGQIIFDDREITRMPEADRRQLLGRDIAYIPQNPMTALNPVERIEPQISDVMRMHLGIDRKAAKKRVLELLESVHLRHPEKVLRQYPHELSGGMRQRVLIAIAFACRPKLVIADEPTTALDVTVQKQILRLIVELQSNFRTAILFISHDMGVVAKLCDHVNVMYGGRVVESATADQVFSEPQHPYTRALLAATPRFDRPGDVLQPVPSGLVDALVADNNAWDMRAG